MVDGGSIFHGVGVGFLLACLGMVELLWELGYWEGKRKKGSVLYPVWNRPRGITGKEGFTVLNIMILFSLLLFHRAMRSCA